MYTGRVLLAEHIKDNETVWRRSKLLLEGRTAPAKQLPAKEMRAIEDLDPSALPVMNDAYNLQGAQKFQQIGDDAAEALVVFGTCSPHTT